MIEMNTEGNLIVEQLLRKAPYFVLFHMSFFHFPTMQHTGFASYENVCTLQSSIACLSLTLNFGLKLVCFIEV